jgi:hypothetical protein
MKAKINNKNSANSKSKGTDKLTKTKTKLGSNQKNNFKPIKGKSAQLKNKHLKNYLDSQSHFLNDLRVITPSKSQQEEKLKVNYFPLFKLYSN